MDNLYFTVITILEAAILASSLSLDALTAGFAYGSSGIKIPFASTIVITVICSFITGLGFLIGDVLKSYIPSWIIIGVTFIILFILGIIKLLDRNITKADMDFSKTISPIEAAFLASSLSLDGLAVGIGAALGNVNGLAVFLFSLITNTVSIMVGCFIGNKIAIKTQINLSWLSGIVLIIIAFLKLF